MKNKLQINESKLELIIRKTIKENFAKYSKIERMVFVQDVLDRIGQYGDEYVEQLNNLNSEFPSTKYKRDF
jgi:hypothetical protein